MFDERGFFDCLWRWWPFPRVTVEEVEDLYRAFLAGNMADRPENETPEQFAMRRTIEFLTADAQGRRRVTLAKLRASMPRLVLLDAIEELWTAAEETVSA